MATKKKVKKKVKFVDFIITICLIVCLYVTTNTIEGYRNLGLVMEADTIHELLRFWGSELLMILLRQVLGSDVVGQIKETKKHKKLNDNEDDESI